MIAPFESGISLRVRRAPKRRRLLDNFVGFGSAYAALPGEATRNGKSARWHADLYLTATNRSSTTHSKARRERAAGRRRVFLRPHRRLLRQIQGNSCRSLRSATANRPTRALLRSHDYHSGPSSFRDEASVLVKHTPGRGPL